MGSAMPTGPSSTSVRVFLVDDHEMVRRGLRDLLMAAGGFVIVGESGSAREAVRRIPAARPDVALLDVRLPDGSGIEVCRQLRALDPSIRVLMVTTYDDEEAQLSALLAGASGVVLKEIRSGDLVDSMHRVARGEQLLDATTAAAAAERARQAAEDPRLAALTPQERRVLDCIAEGLSNRQTGARLGISEKTVKNHVTQVLAKLALTGRTQAAIFAVGARHR